MIDVPADLHIHTALSPCAAPEMTPPAIVRCARESGLRLIAICDHNSAGNAAAVQAAAAAAGGPAVLAGIEIATAEDIHVLGIFPDAARAGAAGREIGATLPRVRAGRGEEQRLMDAAGNGVGTEERMLAGSSAFALAPAVALIRRHGGLAIASHADRHSFSVTSQLGLWPTDVAFDAIEVSAAGVAAGRDRAFEALGIPLLTGSDSHFLSDIGSARTVMRMEGAPTWEELRRALGRARFDGRRTMRDLSLHLLDLMENSVRAGATAIEVGIAERPGADELELSLEDNGPGLAVAPERALDPFYTTKGGKRVGLGLSLFRTAVEAAGGALALERPAPGGGLRIRGTMRASHVDRKPLGDVAATLWSVLATNPGVEVRLRVSGAAGAETISSVEVRRGADDGAGGLAAADEFARRARELLSRLPCARESIGT